MYSKSHMLGPIGSPFSSIFLGILTFSHPFRFKNIRFGKSATQSGIVVNSGFLVIAKNSNF
jgi:hypothetical protein